jgi:hypothetical protein
MKGHFVVERVQPTASMKGPFYKTIYTFTNVEEFVVLEKVDEQEKASKLHKWRSNVIYERLYGGYGTPRKVEPEIPTDVIEEALTYFRSQITFSKWKETRFGQ